MVYRDEPLAEFVMHNTPWATNKRMSSALSYEAATQSGVFPIQFFELTLQPNKLRNKYINKQNKGQM